MTEIIGEINNRLEHFIPVWDRPLRERHLLVHHERMAEACAPLGKVFSGMPVGEVRLCSWWVRE